MGQREEGMKGWLSVVTTVTSKSWPHCFFKTHQHYWLGSLVVDLLSINHKNFLSVVAHVQALKVVHEALDDSGISPAARHALVTRANRLVARMPKNVSPSLKSLLEQEKWDALPQVFSRLLKARYISH